MPPGVLHVYFIRNSRDAPSWLLICPCYQKCTGTGNLRTGKAPVHPGPNSALFNLTENNYWGDFAGVEVRICPLLWLILKKTVPALLLGKAALWTRLPESTGRGKQEMGRGICFDRPWPFRCNCLSVSLVHPTVYWAKSVPDPTPVKWTDHILGWRERTLKSMELC